MTPNFETGSSLRATFEFIKRVSPRSKIIVVGTVPQYSPTLPRFMLSERQMLLEDTRLVSPFYDRVAHMDRKMSAFCKEYGVLFVSALDSFCSVGGCLVTSRYEGVLMPTAWDYAHLTAAGSAYLALGVSSFIEAM